MSKKPHEKQDITETTKEDETHAGEPVSEEPSKIEALPEVSELEKVKEELVETKNRLLRIAADFENYKKISQREQQNSLKFANENLISSLLPIVDNLEQAIFAWKKPTESKDDVLVGIEMVLKQFLDLLKKFGVEVFSAKGSPFDPSRHEAVNEQIDDSVAPGTVVCEYQKGYLLHGRLLRPARVAVSKK